MINENQRMIAETTEGMMVVDAGPGTGKTHTIVQRYRNILSREGVDPRDVLLLTFTNNAAAEMRDRIEGILGTNVMVQATTFDAFCLDVVMESAESVSSALGFGETLTRGAKLIQSRTLNLDHFRNVYSKFMKTHAEWYKGTSAIASGNVDDLFGTIEKMMSMGIVPLPDYEWMGGGIEGDPETLLSELKRANGTDLLKRALNKLDDPPEWYSDTLGSVPDDILEAAVYEDRRYLIWMVHDVYREYLRSSISGNRLTFGMVELFALAALCGDENVRGHFSFRYVMIDEFQDTNELQMKIALLIMREGNLCAVGDWKQGIYGFRNVSIDNIIDFEKRTAAVRKELNKDAERIKYDTGKIMRYSLNENYRSSQIIIDAAFRALSIKATEKEKLDDRIDSAVNISASRGDIREYTEFETIRAASLEKEVHAIAQKAFDYVNLPKYVIAENGTERRPRYGDIAVLCRSNEIGRMIRDRMERLGIPAFLQGDAKIMRTREAKLALAWLRYVNNENDKRGAIAIMADLGYTMEEMETVSKNASKMPQDIRDARKRLVPKKRRMVSLLSSIFSMHGLNNDITQSIISVISEAHSESLLTVSDVIKLIENDMERSETYEVEPSLDRDAVTVQTIHKSKGLEYPIVIVAGLNQRSFPRFGGDRGCFAIEETTGIRASKEYVSDNGYHRIRPSWKWNIVSSVISAEFDEQRRLLFVALSRAKQYVTMTSHDPSSFFKGYGDAEFIEPSLEPIPSSAAANVKRPNIEVHRRPRLELSVHDLIGEAADGGGKGTEYGNKVHDAAHMISLGYEPKETLDEIPAIKSILESVSGADILTETECILPADGAVIKGVMDMIAVYPERAEVHDYKTDMNDNNIDRYKRQLGIYGYIAQSYLKRRTECFIHFVSRPDGKTIKADPLTEDEIRALVKKASENV